MPLDPHIDPRIYVLGSPDKPEVPTAMKEITSFLSNRVELVGSEIGRDASKAIEAKADYIIVLGGDGSILSVARSLGAQQIPLIGVNFGKLGFLTHFSVDQLLQEFDTLMENGKLITERLMLEVTLHRMDGTVEPLGSCLNDCVVHGGPPFRLTHMDIELDGQRLCQVAGDGLIVCTPTGSTAHNLSAGGPLLMDAVHSVVLTPINPHSLTHRPIVIDSNMHLVVKADQVNEGTIAQLDGQVSFPLHAGDRVHLTRSPNRCRIMRNPAVPRWHNLVAKLGWGTPPNA